MGKNKGTGIHFDSKLITIKENKNAKRCNFETCLSNCTKILTEKNTAKGYEVEGKTKYKDLFYRVHKRKRKRLISF